MVKDLIEFSICAHLLFWQAGAAVVTQGAESHLVQTVAGRTDLRIDLKTALKLGLVIAAERTLEREIVIGDFPACGGRYGLAGHECKSSCGDQCYFAEHVLVLSHSAGFATALGSSLFGA